ncbi:MAG TPA: hypothetical protein VHO69_16270 [Phototrophicaceae bacterium]|nr:hypothetical protein [Phototrophicaceae bacterium]
MRRLIVVVMLAVLLLGLAGSAYASYTGFGMVASGAPYARVGSIGGPAVMGGGPGSGK